MPDYATIQDIQDLKRPLTAEEQQRAGYMIPIICNEIRELAFRQGKDFDAMLLADPYLADVAKAVVCDVVMRELNTPGNQIPVTSYSEGAGGVTQSYSLPNTSGALKLWPSDKKALGLMKQKLGAIDLRTRPGRC